MHNGQQAQVGNSTGDGKYDGGGGKPDVPALHIGKGPDGVELLKVAQLRDALRARGLSTAGRKSDLLQRLENVTGEYALLPEAYPVPASWSPPTHSCEELAVIVASAILKRQSPGTTGFGPGLLSPAEINYFTAVVNQEIAGKSCGMRTRTIL